MHIAIGHDMHKVPTVDSGIVRRVDHDRQIAKIRHILWVRRKKEVSVPGFKRLVDGTEHRRMFPTQVTHLARLRRGGIARRVLGPAVRVEVGAGSIAASILGDWKGVDVERWDASNLSGSIYPGR